MTYALGCAVVLLVAQNFSLRQRYNDLLEMIYKLDPNIHKRVDEEMKK